MKQHDWAYEECKRACEMEGVDFESNEPDIENFYGRDCYKSALKAYHSLCEDGHSGSSFEVTAGILIRLLKGLPLTPITEEDFGTEGYNGSIQCSRMSSLFKQVADDGTVTYSDVDRVVCRDIEYPSNTYTWGIARKIIDGMYPITLPYYPNSNDTYTVYEQTFLTDYNNGDYDTVRFVKAVLPSGETVMIDRYFTEKEGKMTEIGYDEFKELEAKRIDTVDIKMADRIRFHFLTELIGEGHKDLKEVYDSLPSEEEEDIYNGLRELTKALDCEDMWQYNTLGCISYMCNPDKYFNEEYANIPACVAIAEYLSQLRCRLESIVKGK